MIDFLPMTKDECFRLGWSELDIIIVTGDAYIDHPSFGTAIIGRYLANHGFKVGVISQPEFRSDQDFSALGKPKLFFGVSAGNMDSMVNHYTAQKKIRSEDSFSPQGIMGLRPDRATIVYTQKIQQLYKETPVIIGGIEASLRRISHYDYWQNKVRNSILFDSKASLLVYGMAEKTILNLAKKLDTGSKINDLTDIPGTVASLSEKEFETTRTMDKSDYIILPSNDEAKDEEMFLDMNRLFHKNCYNKVIYQKVGNRYLKHNKPSNPLNLAEMDLIYNQSYQYKPHPIYSGKVIPAYQQIKESVTSHRGCFGGCNFCSLYFHQGKKIQSRSKNSIINEIKNLTKQGFFKGTITDIGGPSANMYGIKCENVNCSRPSCLSPNICIHLDTSHQDYLSLLKKCGTIEGVRNLFISSGIRTDLAIKSEKFIEALVNTHTGGRIKIAPEHNNSNVLRAMNKQDFATYQKFCHLFFGFCKKNSKNLSIIPYFMVGHPGTTLNDAIELAIYLKTRNIKLKQIQEFTPTPMSISTTMYFTKVDFYTGKKIYVPQGRDIRLQKALAQWFIPDNKKYVIEALKKAKRKELISFFYD